MKAIFLTFYSKVNRENSGGQLGSEKNYRLLQHECGEGNVEWITVTEKLDNVVKKTLSIISKNRFEPSKEVQDKVIKLINDGYGILFYDYARGGKFLKKIKRSYPNVRIIKFFHDVDIIRLKAKYDTLAKFKLRGECRAKEYFYLKEIDNSTKLSVKYADKIGALHSKDGRSIQELYGRTPDFYLPVTFDRRESDITATNPFETKKNMIFVAVLPYFPNLEGIRWFKECMNSIDANLYIIGRGSEKYREELEASNIKVLGEVDDLSGYYNNADVVIVPLLSGGGMKVKVCEAMSYGKTIFGTDEAFAGYDMDLDKIGGLCNTKEEFITKINEYFSKPHSLINQYSLDTFEEKYTNKVAQAEMDRVLASLEQTRK